MIHYLTLDQVIKMHDAFIEKFGGLKGIRDNNLLVSAIENPKMTMFGKELYPSFYEKAAIYLYSIVQNHPFNDANKRTGYGCVIAFFMANSVKLLVTKEELEEFVMEVAKGNKTKEEIAKFLEGKR